MTILTEMGYKGPWDEDSMRAAVAAKGIDPDSGKPLQ